MLDPNLLWAEAEEPELSSSPCFRDEGWTESDFKLGHDFKMSLFYGLKI